MLRRAQKVTDQGVTWLLVSDSRRVVRGDLVWSKGVVINRHFVDLAESRFRRCDVKSWIFDPTARESEGSRLRRPRRTLLILYQPRRSLAHFKLSTHLLDLPCLLFERYAGRRRLPSKDRCCC